jgi:hypothetical protein
LAYLKPHRNIPARGDKYLKIRGSAMSLKKFYHEINLVSVAQLINARIMNVTSALEAEISVNLSQENIGYIIYNVDDKRIKTWNGSAFDALQIDVEGDVKFKGLIDASVSLDSQANFIPVFGYQYIVATAGTLEHQALTFSPSAEVEQGDVVLIGQDSIAHIIQRNDVQASQTVAGNTKIATPIETLIGENDTNVITPATLKQLIQDKKIISQSVKSLVLVKNVPFVVGHNLGLENPYSFTASITSGGTLISADIKVIDENTIEVTSLEDVGNATITIQGFKNYGTLVLPDEPEDPEEPEDPAGDNTLSFSLIMASVDQTSVQATSIALSDDF